MFDVAHMYSKFIGPLPSTAEDYVSSLQKLFPTIVDTKILLNANGVFRQTLNKSNTSLSRAFVSICPHIALGIKTSSLADRPCVEVEVQVDEKRSSNWNSGAKHEAGYDAFMTGCIFAQACNHLGIDFTLHVLDGDLAKETKLQNYINRLYLSWVSGNVIDLSSGKHVLSLASGHMAPSTILHNFYIFPRQEIPGSNQSREFLCQTTSLDFLAKYQFDFNLCVREGISYLSRNQEKEALERIRSIYMDESSDSVFGLSEDADFPLVRMADVLFAERMKNTIREWRDSLLSKGSSSSEIKQISTDPSQRFQMVFFKTRPGLALSDFTSRQLRVIKAVTKKHFKDLAYIRVTGEATSPQQLIVYTDSNDDRNLLMKEVKDGLRKEAEMKVESAVGFRHVIDLLSSKRKLIVGHNCFLDVAHMYSKFIGPLPSTAEDYVSSLQKLFPAIVDTKILLNANGVFRQTLNKSNTSLSRAFVSICPHIALGIKTSSLADRPCVEVEVQVDEKRSSNWNSGAKHEAGYDAFMTGCIFAQACNHLGIDFTLHVLGGDLAKETKLQNYINRLYLSWVSGNVIDLSSGKCTPDSSASSNLKSRYQDISFPSIILLWGLPSKLKAKEIRACIAQAFGPNSVSSVYYLDESAVFIQFSKPELVSKFLEMKETLSRNSDPISVLHPLSNILNGEYTHASTYDVYQQICSSSISKKLFADQAEAVGIKHKTVSSRAERGKRGNQVFDKETDVRMFDEKADDLMSSPYGCSETDRSAESFYLDEVLASK